MTTKQKTSLKSLWYKKLNGTTFAIRDTATHGMGQHTLNRIPSIAPAWGRSADGTFEVLQTLSSAPGDLDTIDISFLEEVENIHELLKQAYAQKGFYMQRLTFGCPPVSNRALWQQLEHFKIVIDAGTRGQGPNLDGTDELVQTNLTLKLDEFVHLERVDLSALTTTETEDILCVTGLGLENDCLAGWPGADQILIIGADATSSPANLLYSMNGGGSIAAVTTDPSPFAENSGISCVVADLISTTQFRVICGEESDATTKAKIAYQDFVWVGSIMTAASWNVITIEATTTADAVEALFWLKDIDRLYIGAAGDVYISTDSGESDPGVAKFTGANALAQFTQDEDGNVWAVGASNTILRELANKRDTFAARTGPSGGGAFSAIAFADDGKMFAGNGQSLYVNNDKAGSTNGWTSLKDFGASHVVKAIQVRDGVSNCIRVVVDDTTPGAGSVFESEDCGNTWREITALANNVGYNGAYFLTSDQNQAVLVGDDDATTGVIELLS